MNLGLIVKTHENLIWKNVSEDLQDMAEDDLRKILEEYSFFQRMKIYIGFAPENETARYKLARMYFDTQMCCSCLSGC